MENIIFWISSFNPGKLLVNYLLDTASSRWQNLRKLNASLKCCPSCLTCLTLGQGGLASPPFYLTSFSGNLIGHMLELCVFSSILCVFHYFFFLCCVLCNCSSVPYSLLTFSEVVPDFVLDASIESVILYFFLDVTFFLLKFQLTLIFYCVFSSFFYIFRDFWNIHCMLYSWQLQNLMSLAVIFWCLLLLWTLLYEGLFSLRLYNFALFAHFWLFKNSGDSESLRWSYIILE